MSEELNEAAEAVYEALVECLPNEAASAAIRAKPAMLAETYRKLLPELKARAFTITGIERADALQRIRDRIANLPQGADWDEVKRDILVDLSPSFVDADADEETQAKQQAAAERRAELLIRHHGFQAYQAGMFDLMDRQKDALPYWQYVTVGDDRVRDEHRALDGLILPADSPFWKDHFPPWDWGCRCQVVPIDRDEFEEIAARSGGPGSTPAGSPRVLSDVELRDLEQSGRLFMSTGQVVNVSARHGEGALEWNPRDLRIPLEDLRKNYDAEVFAQFERDMRAALVDASSITGSAEGANLSVWEWLNGAQFDKTEKSSGPSKWAIKTAKDFQDRTGLITTSEPGISRREIAKTLNAVGAERDRILSAYPNLRKLEDNKLFERLELNATDLRQSAANGDYSLFDGRIRIHPRTASRQAAQEQAASDASPIGRAVVGHDAQTVFRHEVGHAAEHLLTLAERETLKREYERHEWATMFHDVSNYAHTGGHREAFAEMFALMTSGRKVTISVLPETQKAIRRILR